VSFSLPRERSSPSVRPFRPEPTEPLPHGTADPEIRILHLEDNPDDAVLVMRTLKRDDIACTIHAVQTRDQYLDAIRSETFDLILSDHGLPGFDGLSALRLIRARDALVPFILVSGSLGEEAAIETIRSGVTDYVLKDRLARLAGCVRRALAEARVHRERKIAEDALRRSERRFQVAITTMAEGLLIMDAKGRVVVTNPAAARLLGIDAARLVGMSIGECFARVRVEGGAAVLPADVPAFFGVGTGRPQDEVLLRITRPDKSATWALVNTRPMIEGSAVDGIVATLHDVTERRRLQAHLLQAQKMDAIGRLSAGIAHDFNNLLTSVIGYSDLLLDDMPDDDPRRGDIETMKYAGEQGAALTRQLLAFGRQQMLELSVVDAAEVAQSVGRLLGRVIGEHVQMQIAGDPGLRRIRVDRGQLEQVVMNLAVNARDAMPRGGRLTIETRNVDLDAQFLATHPSAKIGPHVMVAVSDTGEGMAPDVRARIFEPFFTTKPRGRGTGLGLAAAYGIVKQFGGSIEVDSEVDRGSTFKLFFPAIDEDVTARSSPVNIAPARRGATILVVEDEEGLRNLIVRILEIRGYRTIAASSGEHALELMEQEADAPALLLADAIMTGISGPVLAARLRERWPALPVLMVSGYARSAETVGGEYAFLEKPFSPGALAVKVSEVLNGHS
jgi:two-component system cell cycle sensor histidine kinase/response regulator CckA